MPLSLLFLSPQVSLRLFSVCVRTLLVPLIVGVRVEFFRLRRCDAPLAGRFISLRLGSDDH